jgi:hypothetical protein
MLRGFALAALFAALAGCSEYLDRRETISLNGGNSVATNKVTQMVDPWPRASADRNIAFNGERMESAVARYRVNKVIPPQGIGTSSARYQSDSGNGAAPAVPASAPPPAPVK